MTSSLAMQFAAGFSPMEVCNHNLKQRVFREKNSSPEGFSVTIPSTGEYVKAKGQEISPISLTSTASITASTPFQALLWGVFLQHHSVKSC
jgi:hypothetical protein